MRWPRASRSKVTLVPHQVWLEASTPNFSLGPLSPRAITMASNEGIKEKKPSAQHGWVQGCCAVSCAANKPLLLAILNSYPKKRPSVDLLFCLQAERPKFGSVCYAWHISEIKLTSSSNNRKPSVGASRKKQKCRLHSSKVEEMFTSLLAEEILLFQKKKKEKKSQNKTTN